MGRFNLIFESGDICKVRNAMLRVSKPRICYRGVRRSGHAPPKLKKKCCNFVRFGVYFAAILSEKNCKNVHFLYKSYRYCITAHYIGVLEHTP